MGMGNSGTSAILTGCEPLSENGFRMRAQSA